MNLPMLRRPRILTVLLVGGALIHVLAGCDKKETSATHLTGAIAPGASTAATTATQPALADGDIAQAVRRYMQEDNALRAEHVQIGVIQGIATISGSVGNMLAKERALHVTETIRGVRSVVDQVTVTPIATTDEQLKAGVMAALRHDLATRPLTVGVAAKQGVVTLSGTAESWQQRNLVADVAKTVRGVTGIDNELAVHYATNRTEAEMMADVRSRIANDVWMDGNPLLVTVTGHTVKLRGVVGSVSQKSRAIADAWVLGVDAVDDSGVGVDWLARNDQRRATDYPLKSDDEISQAVRDSFRFDPRLKLLVPQAAVQYGIVTLSGAVDSQKARGAAEADARDTIGVWSVRNEVVVQPIGSPTDADIQHGVKRVLGEDLLLPNAGEIQASTTKGKVALTGMLASGFERYVVIADVESVPGVREIDDGMTVKRAPAEVKSSIEDRLFWDPMIERDQVSVTIASDGVVTLSGTLDSWGEIRAAVDDARWAGAKRVVNVLKLKNHPDVAAP